MDIKQLTARELKALEKRIEADRALADHRAKEETVDKNTARLRALRLARDAENPPAASLTRKPKIVANRE